MTHQTLACIQSFTACAMLAAATMAPAFASNSIASNYARTGATDSLVAPFNVISTATLGAYAGPVEVLVSGTGFSQGNLRNDAFYSASGVAAVGFYMLSIGWDGAPLLAGSSSRAANNFISFIDNVGPVPLGSRPAYAPNNTYRFVIDVPPTAGALRFGVSDGNFSDNGGAYNVQVWQLQAGVVPEPGSVALMLAGLGALGWIAQRRRLAPGG